MPASAIVGGEDGGTGRAGSPCAAAGAPVSSLGRDSSSGERPATVKSRLSLIIHLRSRPACDRRAHSAGDDLVLFLRPRSLPTAFGVTDACVRRNNKRRGDDAFVYR